MPSALRIKGDLANMPKPQKGLNKRIEAKSCHKLTCPRCGQDKPAADFFGYSWTHHARGVPTATRNKGGLCNRCKSMPRGGKKRQSARVRTN